MAFTLLQWDLPGHKPWQLTDTSLASDTKALMSPPSEVKEKHADQYKRKILFIPHNDIKCFSLPHPSLQPPVGLFPCWGQKEPQHQSLACETGWESNYRKMIGCPKTQRRSGILIPNSSVFLNPFGQILSPDLTQIKYHA